MSDIKINKKSNLLEQDPYNLQLQDVEEPNLMREFFRNTPRYQRFPLTLKKSSPECLRRYGLPMRPFVTGSNLANHILLSRL